MAKTNQSGMTARQRKEQEAKRKMIKTLVIALGCVVVVIGIMALINYLPSMGRKDTPAEAIEYNKAESNAAYQSENDPMATITMEDGGVIEVRLYPSAAPNTVANFVELASSGYYDGLIFHRVIPGFMIQGGDPEGTGMGGPGYAIKGEFSGNGVDNGMTHTRGVISMARSQAPDSAGSQFFIMHADADYLDGQYAAFGEVISGMDVVDAIANTKTGANDRPVDDVRISTITVETNGTEYKAEKIKK